MKKSDILVNTLVYAFYMFIACVVIMLAEILTVKVVNLFIVTEYYELTVLRAVVYTVGVNAVLGAIAYKEGYRMARYPIVETIISGLLASLLHALLSLIFHFQAFCAGGEKGENLDFPLARRLYDQRDRAGIPENLQGRGRKEGQICQSFPELGAGCGEGAVY